MTLKILIILLIVVLSVIIITYAEEYIEKKKKINMSFREAMDLVDLPIITFYNKGKRFNFLLDTGSTASVINSHVLNDFPHEKTKGVGTLYGMEGNVIDVSYVKASLTYKDKNYEEEFQVVDMSSAFNQLKAESGVTLSGILGSLFFKKYQYVLNFEDLIAYSKKLIIIK